MKTLILSLLLGSFALVNAQNITPPLPPCLKIVEEVDYWKNPHNMAVDTCQNSQTKGDYYGYGGYLISISKKKAVSIYLERKHLDLADTTWHVIDTSLPAIRSVLQHLEDSLGTIRVFIWKGGDGEDSSHLIMPIFPTYVHAKSIDTMFGNVYASGEDGGWTYLPRREVPLGNIFEPISTDIDIRESVDKQLITVLLPAGYVSPSDILITNLHGDEVRRIRATNPSVSAYVGDIPAGLYFVVWNGHVGRFFVGR